MFETTSDCQHYLGVAARVGVNKGAEHNTMTTT